MNTSYKPQAFLPQQTQPPPSEVSAWTGFVGLVGLAVAFLLAFVLQKDLHPLWKSAELLALCALAMAVFELIRLKTYREVFKNITPRFIKTLRVPSHDDLFARILGAILTLLPFTLLYIALNEILPGRYQSLLIGFVTGIPFVFALIAAYIIATPLKKDAYWHVGMVALRKQAYGRIPDAAEHWRQWALKAFFVPFMLSIVYGNVYLLDQSLQNFSFELFHVFFVLQIAIFVVDTVFGTIGYVMSFKILDAQIRSTQTTVFGWAVCLICYPPLLFVLFSFANFQDSVTWEKWIGSAGILGWLWAAAILVVDILYVWATVIFGLRFSNLTHRGIITNGPYRYFKHPAYFAKNIGWWLLYIPFIPVISLGVAAVNSIQLLFVNYIYYLRARTEEQHLMGDERYRAYVAWIDTHGLLPAIRHAIAKALFGKLVSPKT